MTKEEKRRTLELAAHLSARASDPRFGHTGKKQTQADADMLLRAADRLRRCVLESSQDLNSVNSQERQELLKGNMMSDWHYPESEPLYVDIPALTEHYHLVPKLVWTRTMPTVAGWYWRRRDLGMPIIVVLRTHYNKPGLFDDRWESIDEPSVYETEWSGPIPKPGEPTSEAQKTR